MKSINWQQTARLASTCFLLASVMNGMLPQMTTHAQFTSPPDQGAPKGSAGGGSRPAQPSVCLENPHSQESLLAMAPTQFVGLTSDATPTIWIYVPNTTAKTLEFSLFTQEKEGVYQTNLPVSAPGLLKVTVPSSITLTMDKPYYWTAALVCNPKRRTEDWVVSSWIQQQLPAAELRQRLAHASVEQQVNLYIQSGFWFDALNTYLGSNQRHLANSTDKAMWATLLSAAGLNRVAPQRELLRVAVPALTTQATR